MTTTRPCPHCGKDYDIARRMHGDRVYCLCGNWSAVVMFPDGRTELRPCDAPDGSAAAGEISEAAALLAELNTMRVELEAVQAEAAALRTAATDLHNQLQTLRHPDMSTLWRLGGQPLEDAFEAQKAALISGAGRLLLDELVAARAELGAVKTESAALRETLEWRHNCEGCGGRGSYWVDVNGEAEAEVCDCWIRADHVLYHEDHDAGKKLLVELYAARAVIEALRCGTHSTVEDALAAYDEAVKVEPGQ